MFIISFCFLVIFLIATAFYFFTRPTPTRRDTEGLGTLSKWGMIGSASLAAICFVLACFTTVGASQVGVVTTFGKVSDKQLSEGLHFVLPWQSVHEVNIGMDVASAEKSQAGSKDLQSVHSTLTVNFHVKADKVIDLYRLNPSLQYKSAFVVPATYEIFKAIVAKYTAEELITKRQGVSDEIIMALNARLAQYHLVVQTVNLVDFGFSKAFDAAIEEKVTASQKAATAERNKERVRFEAEARILQAKGEAEAIAIQSAAVEKQGGQGYIQLQAISKWNGQMPQYMGSSAPLPFIGVK